MSSGSKFFTFHCSLLPYLPYCHEDSAFHDSLTLLDGDGRDGAGEL